MSQRNTANITARNRQVSLTLYPFCPNSVQIQNLNRISQKCLIIDISRQAPKAHQVSLIQNTQWSTCFSLSHFRQLNPFIVLNRIHLTLLSQFAINISTSHNNRPLPTWIKKTAEWSTCIYHRRKLMSLDLIPLDFKHNIVGDCLLWLCIFCSAYYVNLVALQVVSYFGHE